jgi:hypothetical protein
MTLGVVLQFVLQGAHIICPHLLGYLVGDALPFRNPADNGLVSRKGLGHYHRAAGRIVYTRGSIVISINVTAGQRSHTGKLDNIALLDELYY